MLYDPSPPELPVATLVPRDGPSRVRADLHAWLAAKWSWLGPRTVPLLVAAAGMFAVIGSANWLRDYARRAPERLDVEAARRAAIVVIDAAPPEASEQPEPGRLVVKLGPPEVVVTVDGRRLDLDDELFFKGCGNLRIRHPVRLDPND